MKGFGEPVHYSVFRCDLTSKGRVEMAAALADLGPSDGRVEERIEFMGVHPQEMERNFIIVRCWCCLLVVDDRPLLQGETPHDPFETVSLPGPGRCTPFYLLRHCRMHCACKVPDRHGSHTQLCVRRDRLFDRGDLPIELHRPRRSPKRTVCPGDPGTLPSPKLQQQDRDTCVERRVRDCAHDTRLCGLSYRENPEREREFAWAGPIATFDYVLYATKDSGIALQSLEAARNAGTIAVVERDARHDFLIGNQFSNIRTYSSDAECLDALLNGSVSLWVGSSATTPETLRRKGIPEFTLVPVYSLIRIELFIAFNRETAPATVRVYQDTLDAMKADGTFARITGSSTHAPPSPAGRRESGQPSHLNPCSLRFSALVSARVHGIAAAMETLALTGELKEGDWEKIRPLLVRLEQEYPEARFWYARPDGSYYTTVDNLTSANLRDRPYFPGVLAGRPRLGPSSSANRPGGTLQSSRSRSGTRER